MATVNPAVEQLRAAVDRLVADGRSEGIEPDGPLGRWLEGQAQALAGLAGLLDGQTLRFEELIGGIKMAADTELRKASAATDLATHAIKAGELTLRQARTAQIALEVERERLVLRMIKETLPLFADRLKQALVIREQRWNSDLRRRRCAAAGAVALAVFPGGYALRAWSESDRLAAFDRCLSHAQLVQGHYRCEVTAFQTDIPWAGK
jgi:hypothetical protein